MPPLIAPRLRRSAFAAVLVATLVVVALAAVVFHGTTTPFDSWVYGRLSGRINARTEWHLMDSTDPWASTGVLVAVGLVAAAARRWHLLALTVVAPLLAVGVTEVVVKPLVGRTLNGTGLYSYPSGHETGVSAAALVVLVALGQLRVPNRVRLALVVLPTAWMVVAAVALVRGQYHYATDTIGAVGVCTAVVLTTALLLDRVTARVSSPDVRSLPRTSRAA